MLSTDLCLSIHEPETSGCIEELSIKKKRNRQTGLLFGPTESGSNSLNISLSDLVVIGIIQCRLGMLPFSPHGEFAPTVKLL